MDSRELMFSIHFDQDESADDMQLNYYLLSQKNDIGEESQYKYTYGIMIEESCNDIANSTEINDLCPIREEVIGFISALQKNQVTAATLYDVAYDWVSSR